MVLPIVLTPMVGISLQVFRDRDIFHGQQKREFTVILLNNKCINITVFTQNGLRVLMLNCYGMPNVHNSFGFVRWRRTLGWTPFPNYAEGVGGGLFHRTYFGVKIISNNISANFSDWVTMEPWPAPGINGLSASSCFFSIILFLAQGPRSRPPFNPSNGGPAV